MAVRFWLPCVLGLVLGCGDDHRPGTIAESSAPPSTDPNGSSGNGGGGGTGGNAGNTVGAPGDPAPGVFYNVGDVLDAKLAWQGYIEGSDELSTISLSDYHDPTGTLGVRALLITEGQSDCGPCVAEAKDLAQKMPAKWKDLGIKVIQLLVSDSNGDPASTAIAFAWKNKVKASWAVGIDPGFTFAQIGSNPYPIQIIVDPRTLTIVNRIEGYHAELPELEALAKKNQ